MNPIWNSYLLSQGATIAADRVTHFGNISEEIKAATESTVLCDLSHFGVIQFDGEDARGFLQGQLSNDVEKINATIGQITAYCNPKGRVLANGLLLLTDYGYWMQLPQELIEPTRKRLAMFVFRSKINLSNQSDNVIIMGISGPRAPEILVNEFCVAPTASYEVKKIHPDLHVISLGVNRFEIFTSVGRAQTLWQRLAQHALPAGSPCWDWLTIRSGIPTITSATQEQFVPQMINYDLVNGISFEKGCYPGQEIVARTKYLGKLTRRMFFAHIQGEVSPQPSNALFSSDMGDQPCGAVVNTAPAPEGGFDVLAVLLTSSAANSSIHLNSLEGAKLDFLKLPYAVNKTG